MKPVPRMTATRAAAFAAAIAAALTLAYFAAVQPVRAQNGPIQDLASFPQTTLEIRGRSSSHRFQVWVADTDDRKAQGLMFVRDLSADQGMLFPDCCSGIWMKNTYIPLDIVFVGADGRIVKIAANAHPFDETTISPGQPVRAVVELKGGEAAVAGLRAGDRVSWQPLLRQ